MCWTYSQFNSSPWQLVSLALDWTPLILLLFAGVAVFADSAIESLFEALLCLSKLESLLAANEELPPSWLLLVSYLNPLTYLLACRVSQSICA